MTARAIMATLSLLNTLNQPPKLQMANNNNNNNSLGHIFQFNILNRLCASLGASGTS